MFSHIPRRLILITLLLSFATSSARAKDDPTPLFPKALAPGDTIEIIAPAKYLDKERITLATKRLEEMGFKVRLPKNIYRKHGFLGGSDEERTAEINDAFADPEVNAVFPGTGGYGTTRIVDKLDYDVIRRNPKIFIGFSDITGLHIAINQKTGLVTFHSPVPEWGLGSEEQLSPFAAKWFWRAILAKSYRDSPQDKLHIGYTIETHASDPPTAEDKKLFKDVPHPVTMHAGKARGRLIGGNLSVVVAMMGSPYEIQTDGKLLFLEDVGEEPYRVDRMLNTLRLAHKFEHVSAVILGQFAPREKEPKWDSDETMDEVLIDYFAKSKVPVVSHFPIGHVRYNATFPVGAMAELDADAQTVRIVENPVSLP
ncbi:MAG TPA: LD-carboxypeptidase [Lacipirellulaceae bacterium]|jgi:muramoyltetrapeptide carboxypeptidase|nr:LD-carboxypeptidase [Lacipirellulaceae bacterium]